ncbi:hypothetical protein [Nitratireductor sp. StC3]|uniref:hypothetical protein n=1 Tax=Nitratireductor sp. StC3 TaxID=2126741 RepID=UPI0018EC5F13|nr:hypothetical protein [Nitratireductor sp. StC3]
MRFGDIDPTCLAQSFEHAGMVHENVDECLSVYCDRLAGAACAIVPLMQGLELVHGGIELQERPTAYGPVLRSAGAGNVSTSGMFQISAPAAA